MHMRILGFVFGVAVLVSGTVRSADPQDGPSIRDVHAGYLLNCTFRAIRPYIWKTEPLLTGWETDARGGGWESSPSGFFPDSFAFHKDWFKLKDTSSEQAVTLRHKLARQTAGRLTWEMRFMLPGPLEDAAWQLRNGDKLVVGLVVRENKLCFETAAGQVPLLPLEWHHEYGIRVDMDLDGKAVGVRVDGQTRIGTFPLDRSVDGVDSVLISTGTAAVGEMFLPVVRVSKGYALWETFVTCAAGGKPSDWDIMGAANVETLRCASGPDTLSLKVHEGAATGKLSPPCAARAVWEFKLLLPEKCDGVSADLINSSQGPARIVTSDGHFCYIDVQGRHVPFLKDYRRNLWYDFKVIADPKAGSAEIRVNGKLVCLAADFCRPEVTFTAVRYVNMESQPIWLDDVRVYPWHDYPSDYVPQPQSIVDKDEYLLGVQSCSLWKDGDAYAGWEYVYPFADRRKPYLGWYDEGSPEVADWEIKWQVEHGIDFEQYCWYRPNDAVNQPIKEGVLEHGIRDGLFNARYSQLKKFTIMYTNQGAGDTNPTDWREHLIPYWIEYFFKDPRYLKVDGKPVLAIYYPDNFLRDFGGVEGARQSIDTLRAECVQAGFPGIIVLMELRNSNRDVIKTMKAIGIDYCYAYTWGSPDVTRQRQANLDQRDAAKAEEFRMLPSISVGWQTSPWDGTQDPGNGWASVDDYRELARWAKDEFMPTQPSDSLGRRMLMLANWNEFGEGHFIMPSNLAGFGYVDALRTVFGPPGPHTDPVPTPAQTRRYSALFMRE